MEPPRALRRFVRFARLPDTALAVVRRSLDDDEEFRARVGVLADEAELGRAGWLFVARPGGWEEELADLELTARTRAEAEREEKEERSARRRVTSAEAAAKRAEEAAERARVHAAGAAAELAAERRERRTAQDEAARLARRATSLEGERDSARKRAAEAAAEAEALRAQLEAVRAEAQVHAAEAERLRARPPPEPPPEPVAAPGFDLHRVADAVSAAAVAAEALGRALEEASAALDPSGPAASAPFPAREAAGAPAGPAPVARPAPSPRLGRPPRRRPPPLPPAVFDDTPEAAAHLVRVPGVLVMVDGYNAAKALWPDLAPLDLRERLVDALSELEARTGAAIHVVFDGADVGAPASRPAGRRRVRVLFSPADVEADDVILDLLDKVPAVQPVVVASSDRRVQDGARARGASVISSAQLAAVLGRA